MQRERRHPGRPTDHWESLVEEWDGGTIDYDKDAEKAVGGGIQEQDTGRRRSQEGHERVTVNASFLYADDGMMASIDLG